MVRERAAGAEVILTSKIKLTATILPQLPGLRFIWLLATGYNNVAIEAVGRLGITVSNVPAYFTDSVAQTIPSGRG